MLIVAIAHGFTAEEVLARVEATRAHRAAAMLQDVAPPIGEALIRAAAEGRVATDLFGVDGHAAKKAVGVGIVDVGIAQYWAAINDDQSKPLYNKLDYAEVLEGGHCGENRVVFMHLPVPMIADRWWVMNVRQNLGVLEASGGAVRQMVWESRDPVVPPKSRADDFTDNGIPIAFSKGGWWLTALDEGHTLVEYWVWTDPGGSIPAGLASSFAAGGVEDTLLSMVQLARKGSRCPVK